MKKMFLLATIAAFLVGCAGGNVRSSYKQSVTDQMDLMRTAKGVYIDHASLLSNGSTEYQSINGKLSQLAQLTATIKGKCDEDRISQGRSANRNYIDCLGGFSAVASLSAEAQVNTADYYAKKGKREEAKTLYRSVVTNFTGSSYAHYVKRAEFGLEDLK